LSSMLSKYRLLTVEALDPRATFNMAILENDVSRACCSS
jgi:hypothetical protein